MIQDYLKYTLTEATIRPKKVPYGSDTNQYTDGKIGLHSSTRSYYAVAPVTEKGFIAVAISRETGELSFTYSENAYIGRMLHVAASFRRANIREALGYMPVILFLIQQILKQYHPRIPAVILTADFNILNRMIMFLVRSPQFRTLLKRHRFKNGNVKELDDKDGKRVIYTFQKEPLDKE